MKLEIDDNEWKTLLKLIYLGGMITNPEGPDSGLKEAHLVRQKLFALAYRNDAGNMIEYLPDLGLFELKYQAEKELHPFLSQFFDSTCR